MDLTAPQREAIAETARRARLDFVRLFGSARTSRRAARDADLAIGTRELSIAERAELASELEEILALPADIVELRPGLPPLLVREIGARSVAVYESDRGRERYAVLMDRLLAVAEDEILGYPPELRDRALQNVQRRLRVP